MDRRYWCWLAVIAFILQTGEAQVYLLQDDLEGGAAGWITYSYPGAPTCTPVQLVSTDTDPNANHTPGGAYGFKFNQASDRVMQDLDLTPAQGGPGIVLSLWFYDPLDMRFGSFTAFDLRSSNNSQILGFAVRAYNDLDNYYWCRVLTAAGGKTGPNYVASAIQRTVGWHHLEIVQLRGPDHPNTAEFYVDGMLALRDTNVLDTDLGRVVVGLGWSGNPYQSGYADDISVHVIPEPSALGIGLTFFVAGLFLRGRV